MALANYSDLQTSIGNWLKDTTLSSVIPDFVVLAEARFNREIRVPEMEAVGTITADAESEDLPTDFLELRSIWIDGDPDNVLAYMPPHQFKSINATNETGSPRAYTIIGSKLYLAPVPASSYTLKFTYYQKIPALATASTNWLLTSHPDIYLAGSLAAGEAFGWNDERIGLWNATVADAISTLNDQGIRKRIGAAPAVRSARAFS